MKINQAQHKEGHELYGDRKRELKGWTRDYRGNQGHN
jgi:hypothetical protein